MIDASLSAHKEISFEQQAAAHFIAQVLRPEDHLSVFAFDENVRQIAGFSDNVKVLQSAVQKIPDGSGTSIYDALVLGSKALEHRKEDHRRVIILVTDGGETTSQWDFEAARKAAVRANTLLYSIIVRPVKNESGRNTAGEHAIETITDTTGGAIFFPDTAGISTLFSIASIANCAPNTVSATTQIRPAPLTRTGASSQSAGQLQGAPPKNLPYRPEIVGVSAAAGNLRLVQKRLID